MAGFVEIFILFALLYWLFYPRVYLTATSMVDVLAGTFQKVYTKLDNMSKPSLGELSKDRTNIPGRVTMNSLDRHGNQLRKEQRINRKKVAEVKAESTIFEELPDSILKFCDGDGVAFKMTKVMSAIVKQDRSRPIMGVACKNCIPSIKASLVSRACHQFAIENVLMVDTQAPINSYFTQFFCHLTSVWQRRAHIYPKVYSTVLQDERLRDAIRAAADEEYKEVPRDDVDEEEEKVYRKMMVRQEQRAVQIINQMRTNISDFLLKVTSWLMYKLVPRFITSVSAHPAQIEMLKAAGKSGLPLIFLPLHRSHLDYILITFILLCNDIQAPLVAAGDNLKIPFFGWLLRSLGAFFIKRRMDPVQGRRDTVYRAVLHTYMMECLRAGHNIEFFIEGGRTRTGKPCMPKGGLLSVIVDAYMDDTIADALLVPVSLNYEKLVDGNFVREQMGQPKQMETFGNAIKAIYKVLNSNYGMMRIDFHQPFSLMELVKSFQLQKRVGGVASIPPTLVDAGGRLTVREKTETFHQTPSSASLYGTDICHEEHRQLVESIARHVIYDCTKSTAVMSTNAVAFLLLYKFREGTTLVNLCRAMNLMRDELSLVERDVGFSGESMDVVNHALELLGPGLVQKERQLRSVGCGLETDTVTVVTPITMLPNVIELSYYSNTVLSHYIMEAVVVTAMYSLLGDEIKDSNSCLPLFVKHHLLVQNSLLICDILQYEFIFAKPCQDMEALVIDTIEKFKIKEILNLEEEDLDENALWSKRYAKRMDDELNDFPDNENDGPAEIEPEIILYSLLRCDDVDEYLEFLHSMLRPLIDVYTVSALSLSRLVGRQLMERDYVQEILAEMTLQMKNGFVHYGESMAVDPIKCSLKLFEHWRVVECHTEERVKLYYLPEKYDNESEVRKIFDMVYQFKWMPGLRYNVKQVFQVRS